MSRFFPQMIDLTNQISVLDVQSTADRQRLAVIDSSKSRRSLNSHAISLPEIEELRQRMHQVDETRAELQGVTHQRIEELFELNRALDVTTQQHNEDSLLQYMLFASV